MNELPKLSRNVLLFAGVVLCGLAVCGFFILILTMFGRP